MSLPSLVPGSAQVELTSVDDAIIQDHRHLVSCYDKYLAENSIAEKQKLVNEIIRCLSVHSVCEELVLYPYIVKK